VAALDAYGNGIGSIYILQEVHQMRLSIIIAYHNEGKEFILKTIDTITSTIDVRYEIIVVDDFSDVPLKLDGIKVIRHKENKGVGACFDTGVKAAKGRFIFLMGCDVRFVDNNWASKMVSEIINNPKALICTSVVGNYINQPEITFEVSKNIRLYRGASILLFMDNKDMPDRPQDFRNILQAQWLALENRMMRNLFKPDGSRMGRQDDFVKFMKSRYNVEVSEEQSYEVPCILGAAYGVSKKWYKYLDGFWGHIKWGTLEPYISLKCLLFGGKCLVAPHIETTHIFNPDGPADRSLDHISYNKLLVAWLLFSIVDTKRLIDWIPASPHLDRAKDMIDNNWSAIEKKRNEYRKKIKVPMSEIILKFKLH
jgi:glycosyltransferase involved in cell wall biosynthesis